ncbi:MAG: bifunctional nuclease family protein, partial [Candidatus Dadabacteria bacterium]
MHIGTKQAASLLAFAVIILAVLSVAPVEEKKGEENLEEMKIEALGFDKATDTPVVLLTDKKKETVLPIW